jgi:hypothetical protein
MTAGVNRADAALYLLDQGILSRVPLTILRRFSDRPDLAAEMYYALGRTYWDIGLLAKAADSMGRAVEVLPPGESNRDRIWYRSFHGKMLADSGRLTEAVPVLHECLVEMRQLQGDTHADTEAVASILVSLLPQVGRIEEAALAEEFAPYARERFFDQMGLESDLLLHLSQINLGRQRADLAEPYMVEAVRRLRLEGSTRQLGDLP